MTYTVGVDCEFAPAHKKKEPLAEAKGSSD